MPDDKIFKSIQISCDTGASGTVTISSPDQPGRDVSLSLIPQTVQTLNTGWTSASKNVTITVNASPHADNVVFDNLIYTQSDTVVTFEDQNDRAVITGYYPANKIEWTSPGTSWKVYAAGCYGNPTRVLYLDSTSTSQQEKIITIPAGKQLKSVKIGCGPNAVGTVVFRPRYGGPGVSYDLGSHQNATNTFNIGLSGDIIIDVTCSTGANDVAFDDFTYGN